MATQVKPPRAKRPTLPQQRILQRAAQRPDWRMVVEHRTKTDDPLEAIGLSSARDSATYGSIHMNVARSLVAAGWLERERTEPSTWSQGKWSVTYYVLTESGRRASGMLLPR